MQVQRNRDTRPELGRKSEERSTLLSAEATYQQIQRLLNQELSDNQMETDEEKESSILPLTIYEPNPQSGDFQQLSLVTDEEAFHDILKQYLFENGINRVENLGTFAKLTNQYATFVGQRYQQKKMQFEREQMTKALNVHSTISETNTSGGVTIDQLQADKMERDLWLLCESLATADLLHNLQEESSKELLEKALSELSIHATIPEHINAAYLADERLRKGIILTEWLEKCATDNISAIPRPLNEPWSETWYHATHRNPRNSNATSSSTETAIRSLDPDAQLTKDGKVLSLSSNDQIDQERLWKAIWKLIRAGRLADAQQLAIDHHVFWLASTLRGGEYHYYEEVPAAEESSEEKGTPTNTTVTRRVGNPKQPFWLQICWNYAEHLASNPDNWRMNQTSAESLIRDLLFTTTTTSSNSNRSLLSSSVTIDNQNGAGLTGLIEMTIFATLSNHLEVLQKSPLLGSLSDKLWCYLRAIHHHNLMLIVNQYRKQKYQSSASYLACDPETIEQEEKMITQLEITLQTICANHPIHAISFIDSYHELLMQTLPNPKIQYLYLYRHYGTPGAEYMTLEVILYHLQVALMEGPSGLNRFLQLSRTISYGQQPAYPLAWPFAENLEAVEGVALTPPATFPQVDSLQFLRVLTHLLIWCKVFGAAPPSGAATSNNEMAVVIAPVYYYTVLQQYLYELLQRQAFTLIPLYCCFFNHYRLIQNYSSLFLVLQKLHLQRGTSTSRSSNGDAHDPSYREVFRLCMNYFPEYTVEILRTVLYAIYQQRATALFDALPGLFPKTTVNEPETIRDTSAILNDSRENSNYFSKLSLPSSFVASGHQHKSPPMIRSQGIRFQDHPIEEQYESPVKSRSSSSQSVAIQYPVVIPSDPIQDEEYLLMETLYWFSLDRDHALELLKQANRMILYFLSSSANTMKKNCFSKLLTIDYLIHHYIPVTILAQGNYLQQNNYAKLQQYLVDLQQQIVPVSIDKASMQAQTQQLLQQKQDRLQLIHMIFLESDAWMLNQYKLLYYNLLIQQEQYFQEEYSQAYSAISRKKQQLLGSVTIQQLSIQQELLRYQQVTKEYLRLLYDLLSFENNEEIQKLNQEQLEEVGNATAATAERCIDQNKKRQILFLWKAMKKELREKLAADSTLSLAEKEEGALGLLSEEMITLQGYHDVWNHSNVISLRFITSILTAVQTLLSNTSTTADVNENEVDNATLRQQIQAMFDRVTISILTASFMKHCRSDQAVMVIKIQELVEAIQSLLSVSSGSESVLTMLTEDQLLSILSQLQEVYSYVQEITQEAAIKEEILFQLLQRYLQVCYQAGRTLEECDYPSEAIEYYHMGIELSNLIASDDPALLLHAILSKTRLEVLLQEANEILVAMVAINPDYVLP